MLLPTSADVRLRLDVTLYHNFRWDFKEYSPEGHLPGCSTHADCVACMQSDSPHFPGNCPVSTQSHALGPFEHQDSNSKDFHNGRRFATRLIRSWLSDAYEHPVAGREWTPLQHQSAL